MDDELERGVRSAASLRASSKALAGVGQRSVVRSSEGPVKLPNRPKKAKLSPGVWEPEFSNPNALREVSVRLPASMIAAAGNKLDQYVYEGLRDRLRLAGVEWFGPRFIKRVQANRIRRAESKRKFTG
jgi:hypothetical protein